jgi:hypothetical protein
MGLDVENKRTLTNEVSPRYKQAGEKEKGAILDEFCRITGYQRKYAIHLLTTWNTTRWVKPEGKLARLKTGTPKKRKKEPAGPGMGWR